MNIEFIYTKIRGHWQITSPQLPGWACSGPTKAAALAKVNVSLRCYLRYTDDLDRWIQRALKAKVLG